MRASNGTAVAASTQWITPSGFLPSASGLPPMVSRCTVARSLVTFPAASRSSTAPLSGAVMQYPWRRRTVRPGASRW